MQPRAMLRTHNVDRIIHAAAIVSIAPALQMATTAVRVNVEGSINVFEAARILGIRRVIHISSEEVHRGGIDMPRKGALNSGRPSAVFRYNPRYDLRAGLDAYIRDKRQALARERHRGV